MKLTQPLHSAATLHRNKTATIFNDRTQTWGEMRNRVARLAGSLHTLGVKAKDRAAILALNSDRYVEYFSAVWWAGAAVVPMNIRWSPSENAFSLNDSGAQVLLVDDTFAPTIGSIQKETNHPLKLIYMGDGATPDGMENYEALIAGSEPVQDAAASGDDLAGIYYTCGTTGFPKGATHCHRALWCNGLFSAKHFRIEPEDRYLHAAPMFHMADGAGSLGASMAGASHVFIPAFDPAAAIAAFAKLKPTHCLLVPTMIGMMLDNPAFTPDKLASVRHLIYGASPMPEGLLRQTLETLPDIGLIQGYGQTELAPIISTLPPEYHVTEGANSGKLRSAGRPVMGIEKRVVDEEGNNLPVGEVDELAVSGPTTMLNYWNNEEQTKATLKDGWVWTGDGCYIDEDGFIFIVDRVKDMVITGGENVFSAEVESAISTHPAVAAVAVIGIPADKWGEAVHAIVIPKEDAEVTEEQIIAHCRELIANYKLPRSVEFRTEPLPLSGAGKVMKKDLRAPFWEGKEHGVN